MIMLNSGSTSLPWEPYTGGAPSPSPSYPQEIESAGQDGEIGIEVGNNGYIQKGTYFLDVRQFPLKKGYTYYIKGEKIIGNDINCFVLNEYNKNFKNSAELFNYGYTTKKLTIPNSTGIVDEECRMPMRYDKDGYTFTVKAEGLYLYQAVNEPAKNTDEFYVGYTPNIVNEEYKKRLELLHNEDNEEQQMCLKITYDFWNEFVAEYFAVTAVSTKDEFHELSALINDMINNHDKRFIYAILAHLCAFYTETPINDIVPDISQEYVDRIESLKKACLNIISEYSIENMWDIPDDKFNNEITENYLEMFFLILQKGVEES